MRAVLMTSSRGEIGYAVMGPDGIVALDQAVEQKIRLAREGTNLHTAPTGAVVTPADGERYLEALCQTYNGTIGTRCEWVPDDTTATTLSQWREALVKRDKIGRFSRKSGSGESLADAIDVGGDVELAAKLLAEGKHVKLSQPREVSMLLDKLRDMVREAEAAGEKAPSINLCKATIKGKSLFCVNSKGIPRVQMPQLGGVPTKGSRADRELPKDKKGEVDLSAQFIEHLTSLGVDVTDEVIQAQYLKASQNELNGVKVAGMAKAFREGKIPDKPIFVSRDDYVVDGHHRWAAKVGVDAEDGHLGDVTMPTSKVDLSIIEVLAEANAFAAAWGIPQAAMGHVNPANK